MAGLAAMAVHTSDAWMFLGVGMTSAGTGLVLPVIAYLAASASTLKLGATCGGRPGPDAWFSGRWLAVRCPGAAQLWLARGSAGVDGGAAAAAAAGLVVTGGGGICP